MPRRRVRATHYQRGRKRYGGIAAPVYKQLEALLAHGYKPLAADDLLRMLSGEAPPARAFALTFDDGYESVYSQALPILEALAVPATVFLTIGFLDGAVSPPWRSTHPALVAEYRAQAAHFRPLTWKQACELAHHPLVRVGSHTISHPMLGTISPEAARRELVESRSRLRQELGIEADLFSYPFGVQRFHELRSPTRTRQRTL